MARQPRYVPLSVYLNSRLVGQLRRDLAGAIAFQYDAGWLAWPHTLPVSLSLPLREAAYTGEPVLAVFENLLPDNGELRRRIAARTQAEGTDAYRLLNAIGRDCVGALQFLPPDIDPGQAGAIRGDQLSKGEISALLANLAASPLGIGEDEEFRISIAGAQEKTALLYWNRRWFKPHGTTATTHILKPSIGRLPNGLDLTHSVENEYLCLKLLAAIGLPAAKAQMATYGERRVLIVERFDRLWTQDGRLLRLPQEDFCQALSVVPSRKYQSDGGPGIEAILHLLRGSDTPAEDQRTLLKAAIAFWLLGATDGHAKNFSVFLLPGGRFQMTPLYDVISAQPSADAKQIRHNQFRLAMAVGDNRHYIMKTIAARHFIQTANRAGIGEGVVISIFDELRGTAERAIDREAAKLPKGYPMEVAESIISGMKRRLRSI
jgi:serine/threonine-protein kinase HipA